MALEPTTLTATVAAAVPLQGDFLWYAVVFFVLAIVAAVVGMQEIAGMSMRIARIFVAIFLVLAIVSLFL